MRLGFSISVLIISTAFLAFASTPGTIPLAIVEGRPVATGVYLEGQGPFRFLLDTGAQSNQLHSSLAVKLGVVAAFRVELATAAGVNLVPGGYVKSVRLGETDGARQEFLFTTLEGVRRLDPKIDGVLGQQFLGLFDYRIDFRHRTIAFGKQEIAGPRITVTRQDASILVSTSEGPLILDSGTDAVILFRDSSGAGHQRIATANGFAAATPVESLKIRVGDRDYHPRKSAILPSANGRADGLLPASLFRAIYVSNSERYIIPE